MMESILRTGIVAGGFSVLLCWLTVKAATRWSLVGKPALRIMKASRQASHLGGLGLALACLIALAWTGGGLGTFSDPVWRGWLLGASWLLALGLVDDLVWELPPWVKGF